MKPREPINQKIVLVGNEPFTVTSMEAEGWMIEYNPTERAGKMHVLMTRFIPTGEKTGPQKTQLQIKAQGIDSITTNAILTADVREQ